MSEVLMSARSGRVRHLAIGVADRGFGTDQIGESMKEAAKLTFAQLDEVLSFDAEMLHGKVDGHRVADGIGASFVVEHEVELSRAFGELAELAGLMARELETIEAESVALTPDDQIFSVRGIDGGQIESRTLDLFASRRNGIGLANRQSGRSGKLCESQVHRGPRVSGDATSE